MARARQRGRRDNGPNDRIVVVSVESRQHYHYLIVERCPYCDGRHVHDGGPAGRPPKAGGVVMSGCVQYGKRRRYTLIAADVAAALMAR